jgi:hypothetical protein
VLFSSGHRSLRRGVSRGVSDSGGVIARRDDGDTVKPTGIITYFRLKRRLGRLMDPPR